jgi:hypothetical protein
MDDSRFDQLAKALSDAVGSRREALLLSTGGAAAAVLAFLGVEPTSTVLGRKKRRNRKNKKKKKKNSKARVCHCPDATGNNCSSLFITRKRVNQHLRQHPNDYRGRCTGRDCLADNSQCNINRPSECCSENCCVDTLGGLGGVCAQDGGNCCGQHVTGGYCSRSFPQCCGQDACCRFNETCCANSFDAQGYCCPPGQVCDANQPNGCAPLVVQTTSASIESTVRAGAKRIRAGS